MERTWDSLEYISATMVAPLADCYKWSDMGPYNWPKMHLGIFHPYKWISAFYPSIISFFGAKRRPFLRDDNFSGPRQRRSKSIPQWHSVFLAIHLQNLCSKRIPRTKKSHTWSHNSVVTNILGPTKKHIFPIHPFNQNVWNVHLRKPNFWSSQVFSWESWSKIGGAKPPHSPIRLMEEAGHMRLEAPWKGTYLSSSEMKNNCLQYVYPKNHGISKLVLEILQAPCEKQSQIPL